MIGVNATCFKLKLESKLIKAVRILPRAAWAQSLLTVVLDVQRASNEIGRNTNFTVADWFCGCLNV